MTIVRRNYGTGHAYKRNGVKYPGVTTILRQMPKPALTYWAARTAADYATDHWDELAGLLLSERHELIRGAPDADRDAAARRGTEVHRLAEQLVQHHAVIVPDELAGHVDQYIKFLDAFQPDSVAVELVVANRRPRYCGTADLVAQMLGQVWLLELKTSRSGIYRESALQACAYSRAEFYTLPGEGGVEHPLADLGIERCGAVHVRADGYDVRPLDTGPDTWAYFRRLAWLYGLDDETETWVGEAVAPPLL